MDKIEQTEGGTILSGENAVMVMRAATIAQGLELHVRTGGGMRLTRMASPKMLMQAARDLTGKKFKARAYEEAAKACREWAANMATLIQAQKNPETKVN